MEVEEFVHGHTSSRFSESSGSLEITLDDFAKHGVDITTVTEIDANIRARRLLEKGFSADWGDKGPRDDCGQVWRDLSFEKLYANTRVLGGVGVRKENGGKASPAAGSFVVIKTPLGNRLCSAVAHLPHDIEHQLIDGKANDLNGRVWLGDFTRLVLIADNLSERFKCDGTIISFDSNLDLRHVWTHQLMKTEAKGYKLNWHVPYPSRGTFDGRLIDGTLYKGVRLEEGPVLVSTRDSSDHQYGFQEMFSFPK